MSEKMDGTTACENIDRHLWPQVSDEADCPKLFVTEGGGIGINVSGHVIVKPLSEWHKLARASSPAQEPVTTEPVGYGYSAQIQSSQGTWFPVHREKRSHFNTPLYTIPAPPQPGRDANDKHYLAAIRDHLKRLYSVYPNNARLREQISDEIDWIDATLTGAPK